jgi:hypothetical protein
MKELIQFQRKSGVAANGKTPGKTPSQQDVSRTEITANGGGAE